MPDRIQVLAIAVSVAFLILVLELVRRRKLVEEYSFLWIVVAVIVLAVSIWRHFCTLPRAISAFTIHPTSC